MFITHQCLVIPRLSKCVVSYQYDTTQHHKTQKLFFHLKSRFCFILYQILFHPIHTRLCFILMCMRLCFILNVKKNFVSYGVVSCCVLCRVVWCRVVWCCVMSYRWIVYSVLRIPGSWVSGTHSTTTRQAAGDPQVSRSPLGPILASRKNNRCRTTKRVDLFLLFLHSLHIQREVGNGLLVGFSL